LFHKGPGTLFFRITDEQATDTMKAVNIN